jgi:hypothetical protein
MESNISHPGNNKGSFLENIYYHILEETNISVSDIGIVHPEIPRRRRIHPFQLEIQFVHWFHPGDTPLLREFLNGSWPLEGGLNPQFFGREYLLPIFFFKQVKMFRYDFHILY